jgi:transposase
VDLDPALLPDDAAALRAIIVAQQAEITGQRELIGRLRLQLARLRRMQFGRSSERVTREADQLELALEELEADAPAPSQADDAAGEEEGAGGAGSGASPRAVHCPRIYPARRSSTAPTPAPAPPAVARCAASART